MLWPRRVKAGRGIDSTECRITVAYMWRGIDSPWFIILLIEASGDETSVDVDISYLVG